MHEGRENVNALLHHKLMRRSLPHQLDMKSAATYKQNLVMKYDG